MSTETDNTVTFAADGTVAGTTADDINYKELYEQQREETGRLQAVIAVGRLAPAQDVPGKDRKPATTAEQLKAQLGMVRFLRTSRNEKLAALGLNPAEVSDDGLRKLFGRGNDGTLSSDLHKTNPYRYRLLREAAKVLDIYGA